MFSEAPVDERELTTSDAIMCSAAVEKVAMNLFLSKARPVENAVRDWMVANCRGTVTTRPEFEEAVRRILENRWGV